jgi:hypothetical protein
VAESVRTRDERARVVEMIRFRSRDLRSSMEELQQLSDLVDRVAASGEDVPNRVHADLRRAAVSLEETATYLDDAALVLGDVGSSP